MGGVNRGCDLHNGPVRGIIHEKFCVDFGEHPHIKDLIMSKGEDLSERKQALLDNGDCVIVMPGGVGTFDEFWDCVCGKSLGMKGMNKKPIVVVNLDGFYDGFLMQMRRAHKEGILYGHVETYFHVESDPIAALDWCERTYQQGDAVKEMESLIDNIKENNVERVKERKLPKNTKEVIQEVEKKAVEIEEYILDTAPDYRGFAIGVGIGILATVLAQSKYAARLFQQ
jgi:predicted Rossmann-fold nucleotide-binding protein